MLPVVRGAWRAVGNDRDQEAMAHAMTAFGDELRRLLTERGMSLNELARRSNYDSGYLSKVARGHKRPNRELAERLNEVLDGDGALIKLAGGGPLFNGHLSPDDRERLALAAGKPSRVDSQVVDALAAVLAAQRLLEDRIGSAPMLVPARAQSAVTEAMARESPADLRSRVLDIAAQYGYFLGWLHENTGKLAAAERLYDAALGQAAEVGNLNLTSELISMKGRIAWQRGEPGEVVRLSEAAQRDTAAFPGQHAISAMQEARAHAVLGDARAVGRKLTDADEANGRAAEDYGNRPPWLYYHSPGFFTVQRGRAWLHLGSHDPAYNRKAIETLTAGIRALDATARQSEWGASYLLHLASAHMQAGDVDQACAAAGEAAASARQMGSASLLARLRRLHTRMARRWSGHPDVTLLGESLR